MKRKSDVRQGRAKAYPPRDHVVRFWQEQPWTKRQSILFLDDAELVKKLYKLNLSLLCVGLMKQGVKHSSPPNDDGYDLLEAMEFLDMDSGILTVKETLLKDFESFMSLMEGHIKDFLISTTVLTSTHYRQLFIEESATTCNWDDYEELIGMLVEQSILRGYQAHMEEVATRQFQQLLIEEEQHGVKVCSSHGGGGNSKKKKKKKQRKSRPQGRKLVATTLGEDVAVTERSGTRMPFVMNQAQLVCGGEMDDTDADNEEEEEDEDEDSISGGRRFCSGGDSKTVVMTGEIADRDHDTSSSVPPLMLSLEGLSLSLSPPHHTHHTRQFSNCKLDCHSKLELAKLGRVSGTCNSNSASRVAASVGGSARRPGGSSGVSCGSPQSTCGSTSDSDDVVGSDGRMTARDRSGSGGASGLQHPSRSGSTGDEGVGAKRKRSFSLVIDIWSEDEVESDWEGGEDKSIDSSCPYGPEVEGRAECDTDGEDGEAWREGESVSEEDEEEDEEDGQREVGGMNRGRRWSGGRGESCNKRRRRTISGVSEEMEAQEAASMDLCLNQIYQITGGLIGWKDGREVPMFPPDIRGVPSFFPYTHPSNIVRIYPHHQQQPSHAAHPAGAATAPNSATTVPHMPQQYHMYPVPPQQQWYGGGGGSGIGFPPQLYPPYYNGFDPSQLAGMMGGGVNMRFQFPAQLPPPQFAYHPQQQQQQPQPQYYDYQYGDRGALGFNYDGSRTQVHLQQQQQQQSQYEDESESGGEEGDEEEMKFPLPTHLNGLPHHALPPYQHQLPPQYSHMSFPPVWSSASNSGAGDNGAQTIPELSMTWDASVASETGRNATFTPSTYGTVSSSSPAAVAATPPSSSSLGLLMGPAATIISTASVARGMGGVGAPPSTSGVLSPRLITGPESCMRDLAGDLERASPRLTWTATMGVGAAAGGGGGEGGIAAVSDFHHHTTPLSAAAADHQPHQRPAHHHRYHSHHHRSMMGAGGGRGGGGASAVPVRAWQQEPQFWQHSPKSFSSLSSSSPGSGGPSSSATTSTHFPPPLYLP